MSPAEVRRQGIDLPRGDRLTHPPRSSLCRRQNIEHFEIGLAVATDAFVARAKTAYPDRTPPAVEEQGYSVIELLVTICVLVVVLAIALPQFHAERLHILTAQRVVIANLRLARATAINESSHTQVTLASATAMQVAPMVENPAGSALWQVDASRTRSIELPTATEFASAAVGTVVEFNSRGFAVNLTAPLRITTADKFGATRALQVWPSGQVNEL